MQFEDVQPIVDTEDVVDGVGEIANDGGQESDQGRGPEVDVAGGGSDADETGDDPLAGADKREFAVVFDVVDEDPANAASSGGSVGVEGGDHGADGGIKGGTAAGGEGSVFLS